MEAVEEEVIEAVEMALPVFAHDSHIAVEKTLYAPFDRINLLLQSQGSLLANGTLDKKYTGIWNALSRVVRHQGVFSLWRGNSMAILRCFPPAFIDMGVEKLLKQTNKPTDTAMGRYSVIAANFTVACTVPMLFLYPLDFLRVRVAVDPKNRGIPWLVRHVAAVDGIRGFYKGMMPAIMSLATFRMGYYGLYTLVDDLIIRRNFPKSYGAAFVAGWATTFGAFVLSYPLDTLKVRMMLTSGTSTSISSLRMFRYLLLREGFAGLFGGMGIKIARSMTAALFMSLFNVVQQRT